MNTETKTATAKWEYIGPCLYRRGGVILARVRVNGKATWRSTETDQPKEARAWLKKWKLEAWQVRNGIEPQGVTLHRERATVAEIVKDYSEAGCPNRKHKPKKPQTVIDEERYLRPIVEKLGGTPAAALTLGDCDRYRDWRLSGGYVSTFKVRGHSITKRTKGGKPIVDAELRTLCNALWLAVRRGLLKGNPLAGRGRYTCADEVTHCREKAPTPEGLRQITKWLRAENDHAVADVVQFLAYSGLRIGEALPLRWGAVNLGEGILQVKREKRGVNPWVAILPEMEALLRDMAKRKTSDLLFQSPLNPSTPRDASAVRHRITAAIKALNKAAKKEGKPTLGHVTPHGLRSYFVTQARQSGLTDAEIAMLIGDKSGPAIIALTYGDVRDDHLLAQAQRIRLTAAGESRTVCRTTAPQDTLRITAISGDNGNGKSAELARGNVQNERQAASPVIASGLALNH